MGQNATFVRPDHWLSTWAEPTAHDAWQQIVQRYLRGYGPASREEFARWWGMQPATAGRVLKSLAADQAEVSVEGHLAWVLRTDLPALAQPAQPLPLRLLPAFDVYTIGTRPREAIIDKSFEERVFRQAGWVSPVVLVDGRAVGVWNHSLERGRLTVEVEPFGKVGAATKRQIGEEVDRLAQFFDAAPLLSYRS